MIEVTGQDEILRLLATLSQEAGDILIKGLNEANKKTILYGTEIVSNEITVNKTRIKKDFKSTKATKGKLEASLKASSLPISLHYAQPRKPGKTQKGWTVKLFKKGKRVTIPGSFRAKGQYSGVKFLFKRRGKKRYPIDKQVGIRVSEVVDRNLPAIQEVGGNNIVREIDKALGKIL